jgi:hypothetical protein
MRFTWDEAKRRANLRAHSIDFVDASRVFDGLTATYEDDRFSYGEQRFVTLGFLDGIPVSIVHTESEEEIRVISFRRATAHEEAFLFASIENQLPPAQKDERRRREGHRRTSGPGRKKHRASNRQKRSKTRST